MVNKYDIDNTKVTGEQDNSLRLCISLYCALSGTINYQNKITIMYRQTLAIIKIISN